MCRKMCVLITVSLLFATSLHAATLTVRQDGTGDFSDIGTALSAAGKRDVILVGRGTYYESLVVDKSVTIEAESGADATVLDGNGTNQIMVIEGRVRVSLVGFTFANGRATDAAALMIWNQAVVSVEDCAFVDNYATGSNAVHVRHTGTRAAFYRCDFLRNDCGVHSAALAMSTGRLIVEDCSFVENTSKGVAGAVNCNGGRVDFHGNLFLRNSGNGEGALVIQGSARGSVTNNTFHGNRGSGAVRIYGRTSFHNNIITSTVGGPGLVSDGAKSRRCNMYFENEGGAVVGTSLAESEFVTDPMYCDFTSDIFTLSGDSPAVGDKNRCGVIGAFDEGCTTSGAVATEKMTLGGLKCLYR